MNRLKKLTKKQFEAAISARPKMLESTIEAVRAVLVGGHIQIDVADELGINTSQLSIAVRKIYETHLDLMGVPQGWQTITVSLPPDKIEVVKTIEREAKADYEKERSKRKNPIKRSS